MVEDVFAFGVWADVKGVASPFVAACGGCWLGTAQFAMGTAAQAESFKQALVNAYRSNPTLQAERARQRGTDELVPSAKSGWRPVISASGDITYRATDNDISTDKDATSKSPEHQLSQPLFRGFKTVEGVAQAKETVRAGRQQLLAVEQDVLLDAATAYMNVIRDRRILSLREQNVGNLQRQANAAKARFDAGEVTRTDVSQARARVSGAKAQVASARAALAESSAVMPRSSATSRTSWRRPLCQQSERRCRRRWKRPVRSIPTSSPPPMCNWRSSMPSKW